MMRLSAKDTLQQICWGYALLFGLSLFTQPAWSHGGAEIDNPYAFLDDIPRPTLDTLPPIRERFGDFVTDPNENLIDLKDPKVVTQEVEYDPETGYYIITEKVDNMFYRPPTYLTYEEYLEWRKQQDESDYLNRLKSRETAAAGENPIEEYKEGVMTSLTDRLFCGSEVDIRPQGNIDLTFGADFQRIDNPILTERQQRQGGFDFDMAIQMNVVGKIGEKLELSTNYNTQTTFDFDNQVKLKYRQDTECSEDDIVRKIEAGNVSFPLRSSLIQGTQRLFGFRTDLQFGRLKTSFVISQSQSQREELQIEGGAQLQRFEVMADDYDENRHFFLTHYNRDTYEENLRNLPQVNSLFTITKLEVWVTNDRNVTEGVRDVVAFADLGEVDADRMNQPNRLNGATEQGRDLTGRRLPDNYANTLYPELLDNSDARDLNQAVSTLQTDFNMVDAQDFTKIRARKLAPTEYTFHPQLGFVSLNVNIKPVDVVGVAFQYTYNGETYQVGEFAQDLPISSDTLNVMYLKMLKSTRARVDLPIWDLMMKNIYSLNAYQINSEDFRLDVLYQDPGGGEKRFFPEGPVASRPLLNLLNLDNLNRALDPIPDGQFDFVPGITINPQNGRVIFPVLEPFGSSLEREFRLDPDDPGSVDPSAQQYVYQQLYDSTVTRAQEFPEFNRFIIRGSYKSSVSSEISLGAFGIPEGSVNVTAGGAVLTEGQDYTIDYNLGRIKIINESLLNSGQPIRVSYEDNSAFGFNRQSLLGARFDYYINDNFNIGSTIMRLTERPFTQKVNYGDDPIANTIYGFDVQYSADAPWLTRLVDKIPLISTKAPSSVSFMGEFAHLLPDAPNVINQGDDQGGVVFIDDFEGSQANFNLMVPSLNWVLSSTPRDDNNPLFPEANLTNDLDYNRNRARMAWYQMDPVLLRQNNAPEGIDPQDRLSTYARLVDQREVFPNRELQANQNALLRTLDLAYYPTQRGPYNVSVDNIDPQTGRFTNPEDRWAGIMRPIQNNDFEAANIEFLEVWVMSPFKEGKGGDGGMLYIDMGDVSEDILKDSRLFFENGLPEAGSNVLTDTTTWSRIARVQAVTNAFDNDPAIRALQDVGLDGFDDEGERFIFQSFLDTLGQVMGVNNPNYQSVVEDPATDNFLYYRDDFYEDNADTTLGLGSTILSRYKRFNHPDGNSPASSGQSNFVSASTNLPDTEDINRDNTLNEQEAYFQYAIPIEPEGDGQMRFTQYTIDSISGAYETPDGATDEVTWYQLKIPIEQFTNKVGGIQDFRSIRFIRMYMTGFEEPTILRFARMDLVRNQWRRYLRTLRNPDVLTPSDDISGTSFDVQAVNIEENGQRSPYPYVLPPGVQREQSLGAFPDARQNEQSISMRVCNLRDGDARAIFKNVNFDMRVYQRLKMFVHAESIPDQAPPNDKGDLGLFVRIGSDFERNYYEYEIPLTMSSEPNTTDPEQIWLPDNGLDIPLELLEQVKLNRGLDVTADLSTLYEEPDPESPDNLVKVIGNPSLGQVESIMIGVRNREDDGLSRCAEVWVNELRLTGFDERGGTAGLARLDLQLADLGSVTLSGSYSTIGFGSIDQKVNERSRERTLQYDISGSIALDKFLPSKWGIRLPFYGQYGSEIRTPEFDPYQLDIPLRRLLENAPDRETRDSLRKQAETFNNIKSFNFTNVRKERTKMDRAPMPWDVENFSLTYAFTERTLRDPLIESEIQRENRGALDYNYSRPGGYIAPFQKLIKKGKYLQLIKDFNFNLFPNALGFRNELRRRFSETTYRFSDANNSTWFDKKFTWDRAYNVQWDLTRSLKLNFTANNQAIIDEPLGRIDSEQKRDSLWTNIQDFGRNRNYQHSANLSYQVPFKKIPILDWLQARGQYTANYSWTRASLNLDSLGNLLTNGQSRQVNIDANFVNFYNKIKYLQKINRPKGGRGRGRPQNRPATRSSGDGDGKEEGKDGKKKKKKDRDPSTFERILFRPLMMLRRANFSYSEDFTSAVPGFMPSSRYLGQTEDFGAPGLDYAFGIQPDTAWLNRAAQRGWITDNIFLSQQFAQTYQQTYNGKATLEPFKDFRVDVTLNKTLSENFTEYFKVDTIGGDFRHLNPMRMGTMTVSYLPIRSTFDEQGSTERANSSALFELFESNRSVISQRLGMGEHDDEETNPNYTRGYGRYQQDVLIPSFLAAYTGQEASEVPLDDIRKTMPLPNWRLTYNGLSRLPFFKDFLSSFNLTHGYRSTLTVNSFATDLDFQEDPGQLDPNSLNFYSTFEIPDIVISEQFMPLIGIDMRFKKNLTANFDYKRSRQLSMSFTDYQLSETRTSEITIGMGYQMKGVKINEIFKRKEGKGRGPKKPSDNKPEGAGDMNNLGLGKITPKHDWNIKLDVSVRDDQTVNHILDQENSVATRGMRTVRISPSIDYIMNNRLTLRLFYDYTRTVPATSASFPLSNTQAGLTLRFSLAQ